MNFRKRGFAFFFAVLLFAGPVLAEDNPMEIAKEFFDDAQALYVQGNYAEAAGKFLKAYEHKQYPAFLFNIAVCFEKTKIYDKSLEYYVKYLSADPESKDIELVTERIKVIRQHLEPSDEAPSSDQPTLSPISTKSVVIIESSPEGAEIYLKEKKGEPFSTTPFLGSLPPGQHTIIVALKEYEEARKTFSVRRDRMTHLFFSLSRKQTLGWMEVRGNVPGADIYLDRKDIGAIGQTPYSGHLRAGNRKLIVEKRGYEPYEKDIQIVPGKTHVITTNLEKVKYGWIKITGQTTVGATIKIDGKPVKCSEYPCLTIAQKGKHKVELEKKGFKPYEFETVQVGQAEEVQLAVHLNPAPSKISAYVTFGFAAIFLGGGIACGVISNQQAGALERDIDAGNFVDTNDPRFNKGKVLAIVADGLFIASVLAGAMGIYDFFTDEGPASFGETRTQKIAILPTLGPNMAGLSGQVRF
ncbi:MAG: PEGA domain-containing protein [Pseudomonadota bacterium]